MELTYYGHACFSVVVGGKKLLFDPFITDNPQAEGINIADVAAGTDYILITHGHNDHIADAEEIARMSGATIICAWEVYEWLAVKGLSNFRPMNAGGQCAFDFGTVRCTVAHHSSGLPDGSYGGNPMGFIIMSEEGNFYYSGDTALTLDMQLIPRWAKLNFAVLPIGDNFTMGYADAVEAAKMIACDQIIGVHYDTFGYITINHSAAAKAFREAGLHLHLIQPGHTLRF
jgi:L-ascorbate metabolism protein UlaG (beta-lactamase superfamily)